MVIQNQSRHIFSKGRHIVNQSRDINQCIQNEPKSCLDFNIIKIKILKFGKDITSTSARNVLNQYYIQRKTLSEERSYIRRAEKS